MAKKRDTILVLWGKNFDEAAATLFITMLREAGLRVKVVGLDGPNTTGAHGLALVPDITLSQALALTGPVTRIILPCSPIHWRRICDDPRVEDFLQQASEAGTQIVIKHVAEVVPEAEKAVTEPQPVKLGPHLPPFCTECAITYPEQDELLPFIRTLAEKLPDPIPATEPLN